MKGKYSRRFFFIVNGFLHAYILQQINILSVYGGAESVWDNAVSLFLHFFLKFGPLKKRASEQDAQTNQEVTFFHKLCLPCKIKFI